VEYENKERFKVSPVISSRLYRQHFVLIVDRGLVLQSKITPWKSLLDVSSFALVSYLICTVTTFNSSGNILATLQQQQQLAICCSSAAIIIIIVVVVIIISTTTTITACLLHRSSTGTNKR